MKKSGASAILLELGNLFEPLKKLQRPDDFTYFINKIGYDIPYINSIDYNGLGNAVSSLQDIIKEIIDALQGQNENQTMEKLLLRILPECNNLIQVLNREIPKIVSAVNALSANTASLEMILKKTMDFMVCEYLLRHRYKMYAVLHVLGIIESNPIHMVHWGRLHLIVTNQKSLFNQAYSWETGFDGNEFINRLLQVLYAYGLAGGIYEVEGRPELKMPLLQRGIYPDNYQEVNINFSPIPIEGEAVKKAGLLIYPSAYNKFDLAFELGEAWELQVEGNLEIGNGIAGLELKPNNPLRLIYLQGLDSITDAADFSFSVALNKKTAETIYILGSEGESNFYITGFSAKLLVEKKGDTSDFSIASELKKSGIAINLTKGDSFIKKVIPCPEFNIELDLGFVYSARKGFSIKGGALAIELPLRKSLGPFEINTVTIALEPEETAFPVKFSSNIKAALGPVQLVVVDIGFTTALSFPDENGLLPGDANKLGPFGLSFGFKFPGGIGLSIDAAAIAGGGYLEIKDGNYAGILYVDVKDKIAVTAIGILTTKLPDGSETFSLKVLGMAEFPPIQLSMGFILTGIGLAIGIGCTMNAEELRRAVYTNSLNSLLFPPDPIKNAQKIISDLKSFFPPADDHYVFGAMVKLGWGGAVPLVAAEVGIFLELCGKPLSLLRVALAGIAHCELPNPDNTVICLRLQVLGVLDLENSMVSIDASLEASKLLSWPLSGDIALRAGWGDNPRFALSAGGFYPGYRAPQGFPALRRISVTIGEDNPRIGLFLYLAATENSVQFGSQLLFHYQKDIALIGLIELDGNLSFDALFEFNPFAFETQMRSWVSLKCDGDSLFEVFLDLRLSGPNNYRARGRAKFEVLSFDVEVDFDKTFGEKRPELPQQTLFPLQILAGELDKPGNWSTVTPLWAQNRINFRKDNDANQYVDPLGGLVFRQMSVPLLFELEKMGEAAVPEDENYLDLQESGGNIASSGVEDFFAPGQFECLSDREKISRPAFEKMKSGLQFSCGKIEIPVANARVIHYGKAVTYETKRQERSAIHNDYRPVFSAGNKEDAVLPAALANWQRLAGRNVHNQAKIKSSTARLSKIKVREQKFAVVLPEAENGKFICTQTPEGKATDLTYARAGQVRSRMQTDAVILSSTKTV